MNAFKRAYKREPASVPTPSPGEIPASAYRLPPSPHKRDRSKKKQSIPSFPRKNEKEKIDESLHDPE